MALRKDIFYLAIILVVVLLFTGCADNTLPQSSTTSSNVTQVAEYSRAEKAAISVIKWLKSVLNNPSSLEVHSLKGMAKENMFEQYTFHTNVDYNKIDYLIRIDFSAQVPAGGLKREVYYFAVDANGNLIDGGSGFVNQYINQQASSYNMDASFSITTDIDSAKILQAVK